MPRGEPTKTVGQSRAGGEKALTVHCLGCYHEGVKTFEELKLWNDMIFVTCRSIADSSAHHAEAAT